MLANRAICQSTDKQQSDDNKHASKNNPDHFSPFGTHAFSNISSRSFPRRHQWSPRPSFDSLRAGVPRFSLGSFQLREPSALQSAMHKNTLRRMFLNDIYLSLRNEGFQK